MLGDAGSHYHTTPSRWYQKAERSHSDMLIERHQRVWALPVWRESAEAKIFVWRYWLSTHISAITDTRLLLNQRREVSEAWETTNNRSFKKKKVTGTLKSRSLLQNKHRGIQTNIVTNEKDPCPSRTLSRALQLCTAYWSACCWYPEAQSMKPITPSSLTHTAEKIMLTEPGALAKRQQAS